MNNKITSHFPFSVNWFLIECEKNERYDTRILLIRWWRNFVSKIQWLFTFRSLCLCFASLSVTITSSFHYQFDLFKRYRWTVHEAGKAVQLNILTPSYKNMTNWLFIQCFHILARWKAGLWEMNNTDITIKLQCDDRVDIK